MSKLEKLVQKVFEGRQFSYKEAENLLHFLGFEMEARGSHHVFRKKGYPQNVSLKKRTQLLPYQIKAIK
jgi:hypothetical protein